MNLWLATVTKKKMSAHLRKRVATTPNSGSIAPLTWTLLGLLTTQGMLIWGSSGAQPEAEGLLFRRSNSSLVSEVLIIQIAILTDGIPVLVDQKCIEEATVCSSIVGCIRCLSRTDDSTQTGIGRATTGEYDMLQVCVAGVIVLGVYDRRVVEIVIELETIRWSNSCVDIAIRSSNHDLELVTPLPSVFGVLRSDLGTPAHALDPCDRFRISTRSAIWIFGRISLEIKIGGLASCDRRALLCADRSIILSQGCITKVYQSVVAALEIGEDSCVFGWSRGRACGCGKAAVGHKVGSIVREWD
jgi:hypothetical protein